MRSGKLKKSVESVYFFSFQVVFFLGGVYEAATLGPF
jgi:hypothetical protein